MSQINILPKEVYRLIAAGEVVERPASAVKEMVENSVDAGAKNITVEIKNGGTTYIRVTDDGSGIEKSQIKKVFISHATSKIKDSADLNSIGTLGFRGEAMASISAVSRVELLSRTKDEETGTRYEIEGGEEKEFADAGCPAGTTIVVRDIFFNTPARMKFLKKDVTEGNSVAGIVDKIAVSHPEISFRFIRDGKQTLITSGNGDLKSAIYSVFGREFASSLIKVDYSVKNMRVSGYVTKPSMSRKSRAMQYFFINSRFVRSKTAVAALEQAYKNSIMVGKFPGCVLNIECDTRFVDVNVHPAKIEVRFENERPVFELVYYGVKNAIQAGDTPKQVAFESKPQRPVQTTASGRLDFFVKDEDKPFQLKFKPREADGDFYSASVGSSSPYESQKIPSGGIPGVKIIDKTDFDTPQTEDTAAPMKRETLEIVNEKEEKNDIPDFRVVGEAFKTYIIVEIENALYIIDKHAAHERMNFEKLKAETVISSQTLIAPVIVRLSREEYNAVLSNLALYKRCGFSVEDFGNSSVAVRECPSMLDNDKIEDLIVETAGKLLDGKTDITPEHMDWIFHSTSCRAAVKAGDYTSPYERELFVKKLLSMPDIRYCPHGRPVMIKLSKYDIEKQFGRIQ